MDAIGKKVGQSLYVGYTAVLLGKSGLSVTAMRQIERGRHQLPDDFRVDVVCIERTGRIRYVELTSMLEEHPCAKRSFVYCPGPRAKIAPGRCAGQIYHRLDAILGPVHPYYAFYRAITEYEERTGLLGPEQPACIGSRHVWERWVDSRVGWQVYQAEIDRLVRLCPRED